MPLLQRFDLDETTQFDDDQLARRWRQFHRDIHNASGAWWRRYAGQILGDEGGLRYRAVRGVFRPLFQLVRLVRSGGDTSVLSARVRVEPDTFPKNYRARHAMLRYQSAHLAQALEQVAIVTVDDEADSLGAIEHLNEVIRTTEHHWLFVVDHRVTASALHPTLGVMWANLLSDPEVDVLYADEDGMNVEKPILKTAGVGPHTLLSYNSIGRPALVRVAALRAIGGLHVGARRAFEHDAYLRLLEHGGRFRHVPAVLPAGRSHDALEHPELDADTVRVVEFALERRGARGQVTTTDFPGLVRWRLLPPDDAPSIDIVIPTRDRIDLVRHCIETIEQRSTYTNWNIIICDNDSVKPESLAYFAATPYTVVPCPGPFNYAKIVNKGIRASRADFIVTLNNDTEVVTPDWLEQLLALASLPDVSIVGACLLDKLGQREHESIVIAPYPQHLRTDGNYPHRDAFALALKDVAATTGAVQMVRRELWESLGGMDEELHVVMNDVDICLRSQVDGRHVVYTPYVQLHHEVGASRGTLDPLEDRNRFIRRWDIFGSFVDPYFPELLSLLGETMYFRHDVAQGS